MEKEQLEQEWLLFLRVLLVSVEYDQEQLTYLFSAIRLFFVLIAEIPWFHLDEVV